MLGIDGNIGVDIARDIEKELRKESMRGVEQEIGRIYKQSFIQSNDKQENPDGSKRQALSQRHTQAKRKIGANPVPDFRYTGRAEQSLDFSFTDDGIEFRFGDAKASEYMYDHQYGLNGMPERRIFPDDRRGDNESANQQQVQRMVEDVITEHLNRPRKANGI